MNAKAGAPLVSVILPTYNQSQYLKDAIESVLRQSCADFELLIIDDGSTDPAPGKIARDYAGRDDRIRPLTLQKNCGVAAARNAAVAEAKGTYIALQDGDDVSEPKRLEVLLGFLQQHPEIAAVSGAMAVCDRHLNTQGRWGVDSPRLLPARPAAADWVRFSCANITSLMRKDCLQQAGGYRPWFTVASDWDLSLRLQDTHPTAAVPELTVHYRAQHAEAQLTAHRNLWQYHCAAIVSTQYRREGQTDPISETAELSSVLARLPRLPPRVQQLTQRLAAQQLGEAIARAQWGKATGICEALRACDAEYRAAACGDALAELQLELFGPKTTDVEGKKALMHRMIDGLTISNASLQQLIAPWRKRIKKAMRAGDLETVYKLLSLPAPLGDTAAGRRAEKQMRRAARWHSIKYRKTDYRPPS